ncbi:MAG TPA: TolC family protein [Fibrobacteria bacterium]|nr:TolC family protein [Fibrobacteria bacterium]
MHKTWRIAATLAVLTTSAVMPTTISAASPNANPTANPIGLGLDSLISMGLARNADLLAAGQQTETLAQDTLTALPANPSLVLEAMRNLEGPSGPKASAKLSQEFRPGYRGHVYAAAKARISAGQEGQKTRELDLIQDIRSAFYAWQVLNQKAVLQQEAERRWEGLARLAAIRVAEGKISQVDEGQTRLNLAKAKQRAMEIRSDMAGLEKQLGYLAGALPLPDSPRPEPMDSLPGIPPMDSLVAWGEQGNPEVRIAQREIEFGKAQMRVEQNLRNPSFNLSVGYERETDGANLIGGGVEVPLPLFSHNQAGMAKARSSLREAELKKRAAESKVRANLADLQDKLAGLADRYRNHRQEIRDLSRKQLSLSEKGFREGLLGVFDLSRVQEEALAQDMEALDLMDAYYRTWNRLGRVVGGKIW